MRPHHIATARFSHGCRPGRGTPDGRERGAVTVETAVVMPALVLLLAVMLAAAAAGMTLVRFEEAARASARAAARGESVAVAQDRAREIAGEDSAVTVAAGADRVTVTVSGPAPGILGTWSHWTLQADAMAVTEGARNADAGH
ncbi:MULTISPECIES: TadE family type IV pilus minor pilin [unclassified Candidatus Sulfotelmatobacter]|uniref:TadE family type IV pilus minor pilin n=1 Tax=unclassified Candidatus Sulfotelmatobacter TaxID=2635724 RepID=UPI001CC220C2|nr:TadE family type IV pilus minor pilin [Kocuria sp. cx-116]